MDQLELVITITTHTNRSSQHYILAAPPPQATPLFLSSVMENDQAALLLLNKGADPNKPAQQTFTDLDKDETVMYFTPLYELADRNREDSLSIAVVRSLLARGARQDLDRGGEIIDHYYYC